VIILGIILILIGYFANFPYNEAVLVIGIILLIVGLILFVLGRTGRPVGGRSHWF
jgi:hypothetical protein